MSFECCTVQKGDVELRIRIVLIRNASQFLVGESVNLVGVLLLRPVRIPVLPGELVAPGNERRGRIAEIVRGPELPAAGFIGDIDQRLGIDPKLQTVAFRGGFVAVQPQLRRFMVIEEVLQLAQPENIAA